MNEEREMQVRRMLQGFEHKIVEINKRNIREITGEISEEDFSTSLRELLQEGIEHCRPQHATGEKTSHSDISSSED